MRQTHLAGDKLFVDYAGDTVPVVVDRLTGEIRAAHIFVAVMGASSQSFACASWTKTLADWVDGLPLYRLSQALARANVELSRVTLGHWVIRSNKLLLERIYASLKGRLVRQTSSTATRPGSRS